MGINSIRAAALLFGCTLFVPTFELIPIKDFTQGDTHGSYRYSDI